MKKFKKENNIVNGTYSYKKEETGLVPTSTCTDIVNIHPEGEKKKNIKERLLEWYDRHKFVCDMVSGAIVIAIIIFAIAFAVHSCNNSNPSSNVGTTVSTSSSSTQATTVAATTKPKATESTTVQPTTSTKPKKENSVTTNNNNNSNYSSGNSNSNEFGKGGGNSSYSSGKTVSNYDTHEKDKDMSSDKDSKKDEGITGGNKGYGASISSKKESPSPEKKFEEEHTLPPTISQDEINKCPTVPLTPRTTTADNQAE